MNTREIKYFLEIVEQDVNFTKAAQKLYISQPSLSKQISNLELELGVALFDTSQKRSAVLTPAGKIYYDHFKRMISELADINADAKRANGVEDASVSIVCVNGWNVSDILKETEKAKAANPNINISYHAKTFHDVFEGLISGEYDIAITTLDQFHGRPDISSHFIGRAQMCFLYSRNNPLASKPDLAAGDFSSEPLYVLEPSESPEAKRVNEFYCRQYGIAPEIIEMPNMDSIYTSLESGRGFMPPAALGNQERQVSEARELRSLSRFMKQVRPFA